MKTQIAFGGASIHLDIAPVNANTPIDPRVSATLHSFLAMLQKAHVSFCDEPFYKIFRIFMEEVDLYIDDKRISSDEGIPINIAHELEDFMDKHQTKKEKK